MHVRFVSAVSCGGISSFPEAFEAAAEDAAAQGEDGIGAVDGPVHAGALEARPDGMFAASLDDAGGDAQAPGPERGIAHALAVADEIVDAFAGLVAGWGVVGEGGDDGADAAGIEFVPSLFRPLRGEFGPGCVDGLGDVPQRWLLAWKMSTIWIASGKHSSARAQIQGAPSPRMTLRSASAKRRRSASRQTRWAKGEGSRSVSRLAAVSMAAV